MTWCMKRTNIYLAEGQGGHPGADLEADLAAINASFGILANQGTFSRASDQRMDYLDRLADA